MNKGKWFKKNTVIASIPINWECNYSPKNNLTHIYTYSTPHKGVSAALQDERNKEHLILQPVWRQMEIQLSEPARVPWRYPSQQEQEHSFLKTQRRGKARPDHNPAPRRPAQLPQHPAPAALFPPSSRSPSDGWAVWRRPLTKRSTPPYTTVDFFPQNSWRSVSDPNIRWKMAGVCYDTIVICSMDKQRTYVSRVVNMTSFIGVNLLTEEINTLAALYAYL